MLGCSKSDDSAATDDSAQINEGRGVLERNLNPTIAAPSSPLIGAKISDVLAQVSLTAGAPAKVDDACTVTKYTDAANAVAAEDLECKSSSTIRFLAADGTTKAEHADLNKDGKVDRWTGLDGAAIQLVDVNFDGTVDVLVERVDLLNDFSLAGYGETFPKNDFLYRVREARRRDGKLNFEKLIARGVLPPAP
jgi:hypothetical protein